MTDPLTRRQRKKYTVGSAQAETFMNLMPPTDWSDLATKHDLAVQIAGLRADLQKTLGTWLFASQAAVIAAVAVIVGVLS